MTRPIAFDPSAEYVDFLANDHLAEALLYEQTDGRLCLQLMSDDDVIGQVVLRSDFLDALVAARAATAA